jgi:hypothetical protein
MSKSQRKLSKDISAVIYCNADELLRVSRKTGKAFSDIDLALVDLQQEWLGPEMSMTEQVSTGEETFRHVDEQIRGSILVRLECFSVRLKYIVERVRKIREKVNEDSEPDGDDEASENNVAAGDDEVMDDGSSETVVGDAGGR